MSHIPLVTSMCRMTNIGTCNAIWLNSILVILGMNVAVYALVKICCSKTDQACVDSGYQAKDEQPFPALIPGITKTRPCMVSQVFIRIVGSYRFFSRLDQQDPACRDVPTKQAPAVLWSHAYLPGRKGRQIFLSP